MCKLVGLHAFSFKIHENNVKFIITKWDIVYNFLIITTIISFSFFSKISSFQDTPFHISYFFVTFISIIGIFTNFYYTRDIIWLLKNIFDLKKRLRGKEQHNTDFYMLLFQKCLNIFGNIILSFCTNYGVDVGLSWNLVLSAYLEYQIMISVTIFYTYTLTELNMLMKLYKDENIEKNINFVRTLKEYFEKNNHIHQIPILLLITVYFFGMMTPFTLFIVTEEPRNLGFWSILNRYFSIIMWILSDFYEMYILVYYIEKFNKKVSSKSIFLTFM